MEQINGSCHCGKVTWLAVLPIKTVVQCYCENCRHLQGSDYSNWVVVENSKYKITQGTDFISHYDFNHRSQKSFCSCCGTVVFGVNGKHFPKHKLISLSTVSNYTHRLKPQLAVYTDNKAPWLINSNYL